MNLNTIISLLLLTVLSIEVKIQNYDQSQVISSLLYEILQMSIQNQEIGTYSQNSKSQPGLTQVDAIYYNGTIITMNDRQDIVQAISIKNGRIVDIGSNAYIFSRVRWDIGKPKIIDLHGKTMMPGFYDAHSHIAIHSLIKSNGLNLASPPVGNITSVAQIQQTIKQFINKNNISINTVVYGTSYNELGLVEKRHINRFQLDQISKDHIIVLDHVSGHMAVANSKAIQQIGVTNLTPDPQGGKIDKFHEGPFKGMPTGLFKQKAKTKYLNHFAKRLENNHESQKIFLRGVQDYIQAGVTTAQQGFITQRIVQLLLQMQDKLKIDVRGYYPCINGFDTTFDRYSHLSTNRFRLKGVKLVIDGSIQGYTGFLTEPYYVQPPQELNAKISNKLSKDQDNCEGSKLYKGFPIFEQSEINEMVEQSFKRNVDIISHCNGDAAIDMFLQAIKNAKNKYWYANPRLTIIHSQTVRDDQLDEIKMLRVIPSFFVGHTYYWGDQHRDKFLGPVRASRISPTKTALLKGVNFTLHNDAPVTPIQNNGMFMVVWSAVNRLTTSGKVLGPNERIDVMEALKSLTIRAAYQGRQQSSKGSIEKGKIADLIVLNDNPLTIEHIRLREIKVLQTIKNGVSIYKFK